MYSDFMAFPFPQNGLMKKDGTMEVHSCMKDFEIFHATSVPPFVTNFKTAIEEHRWFKSQIARNGISDKVVYGLQNPVSDLNQEKISVLALEGVGLMSLAYFKENEYGGGFNTPDVPLSEKGKELVHCMLEKGVAIDLSHVGYRTAHDALDILESLDAFKSVVVSHSACHSVYAHLRNLPDGVMDRVARLNGIIGIPTMTWLLHESDNSITPFLHHLDYLLSLVDVQHIAIGSDGVYIEANEEEEKERFRVMQEKLDPTGKIFHARLPEEAFEIHGPMRMTVLGENIERAFGSDVARKVTSTNLPLWFA